MYLNIKTEISSQTVKLSQVNHFLRREQALKRHYVTLNLLSQHWKFFYVLRINENSNYKSYK